MKDDLHIRESDRAQDTGSRQTTTHPAVIALIPASTPADDLPDVVKALMAKIPAVVLVNDGSSPRHTGLFAKLAELGNVTVLHHARNAGKGAALKTGLSYIYEHCPEVTGVVTVDADGQHLPEDAFRVANRFAAQPGTLVVGSRTFGHAVPWRSRFGNAIISRLLRGVAGIRLSDTQSGLRAIPRTVIPSLLGITEDGYEFELAMLLACRAHGLAIVEEPITTVYIDDNASSHFSPLADSIRICWNLLKWRGALAGRTVSSA